MIIPTGDLENRINRAKLEMTNFGFDALCISPGPDLRYFIDYDAKALERITCLVLTPGQGPWLLVPRLEKLPAQASGAGRMNMAIHTYGEFDDPYEMIANQIGPVSVVGVDDRMWASKALGIAAAMPDSRIKPAGSFTYNLRSVKSEFELEALRRVSASIDQVHQEVPNILKPGRTELEVARDIGSLILANGHAKVDFIIVAAGPNSASPHHEPTNRVILSEDVVVVDIGGTSHEGYCSDCTRTYAFESVPKDFVAKYRDLQEAQLKSIAAVKPGALPSEVDLAGRNYLIEKNLGEYFIHRTGHGIGVETHEEPYIGSALHEPLLVNQAFSVEPGFYIEGLYGARIEDIVITTISGVEVLNKTTKDLVII